MKDVVITPYRDGPLLVRGPVRMADQDGNEITLDRETIALCRCGKSRMRPFCDGTHKLVRFRAPSGAEERRSAALADGAGRLLDGPSQRAPARIPGAEQVAREAALELDQRRGAPQDVRGDRRVLRARPPARSTAAMFSCTASATTCSSKNAVASARPSRRRPLA